MTALESTTPPGWRAEPLRGILQHTIGGVWGSAPGESEVDVRVFRATELRNDGTLNPESAAVRSITTKQLAVRQLTVGDILVEKSGGGPTQPVGRVVRVPLHEGQAVCSNFIQLLRSEPLVMDAGFLFWQLWFWHVSGRTVPLQTSSTNIRNLKTQDYLASKILVPPLREQERIVAAIEEEFSRLDAAEASIHSGRTLIASLRKSSLGCLFKGDYPKKRLQDLATTQLGKMLSQKANKGTGQPYLRNKNVQWARFDLGDVPKMEFSEKEVTKFRLVPGDVLVCEGGEVGRAAVWRGELEECYYQKALHRIRTTTSLVPEFLVYYLRHLANIDGFDRYITGSTINHLPQEDLRLIPIPAPSVETQANVVSEIDRLFSLADALQSELNQALIRSAALRSVILREAFAGRLTRNVGVGK